MNSALRVVLFKFGFNICSWTMHGIFLPCDCDEMFLATVTWFNEPLCKDPFTYVWVCGGFA